jgi:hypothetical protein
MALRKVKLELARDTEFPDGSAERGYEFYAPLNTEGHLDRDEWHTCADQCTVHRFWLGEGDERGHLVHRGSGWAFHYEDVDADPDEPLFKLDRHTIISGEYLSITEHDGVLRTFRVVYVR